MSLQDYRDFKSWDEIHPGDILTWWREDRYGGYKVEFVKPSDTSDTGFIGKSLEVPYETAEDIGKEEEFGTYIYPNKQFGTTMGWKVCDPISEYDPTQAGDTDEDI
jgi:hypothetical protein